MLFTLVRLAAACRCSCGCCSARTTAPAQRGCSARSAATDWVDGYIARRFDQVSEFGKVFDPTVDRLFFFVGDDRDHHRRVDSALVRARRPRSAKSLVGVTMAVATLVFTMQRFDVTWWGKIATFLLMGAVPSFLIGNGDVVGVRLLRGRSPGSSGIPGLILSYWTAIAYIPQIRDGDRRRAPHHRSFH